MKSQGYYRLTDLSGCDVEDTKRYLTVNCTGVVSLNEPFANQSARGRQDYYLMVVYKGSLEAEVAGKPHFLKAGDMAIYPAKQGYRYQKSDPGEMVYFWTHFSGYGAEEALGFCGLFPGMVGSPGCTEELAACFGELFKHFYIREHYFEMEAAGQLLSIFARLGRGLTREDQNCSPVTADRIRGSLDFLYRNYAENLKLAQLAQMEHLSPSRYSAVFRQCMGTSPQGFLIALRMKNAADLIRRTDLSIKQVAQAVGYEDPLYFSTLFKRKMGISPSQYQAERGRHTG